ncbi:MAG: hypothetical protein K2X87_30030 [Gemmataceae bacterium]|nr:hypothetical protein [Gemmataceae bacterium]
MPTSPNGTGPTPGPPDLARLFAMPADPPGRPPDPPSHDPPADLPISLALAALADRFRAFDHDFAFAMTGRNTSGYAFVITHGIRRRYSRWGDTRDYRLDDLDRTHDRAGLRYRICHESLIAYEAFLDRRAAERARALMAKSGGDPDALAFRYVTDPATGQEGWEKITEIHPESEDRLLQEYGEIAAAGRRLLCRFDPETTARMAKDTARLWLRECAGDEFQGWGAAALDGLTEAMLDDLPARLPPDQLFALVLIELARETPLVRWYPTPAAAPFAWADGDPLAGYEWRWDSEGTADETGRPPGDPVAVVPRPTHLAAVVLDHLAAGAATRRAGKATDPSAPITAVTTPAPAPEWSSPAEPARVTGRQFEILEALYRNGGWLTAEGIGRLVHADDTTIRKLLSKSKKDGLADNRHSIGYRLTPAGLAFVAARLSPQT